MRTDCTEVRFPSGGLQLYGRLRLTEGTAPAFVLLPGLGFHTFEYEPLAQQLARAGMNTLSIDYRGHGRSPGPRGGWVLDELTVDATHAVGFLAQYCSGPIALFGNSLGAMVAILAGAREGRVTAVAAANCPARAADFLLTKPRRVLFALAKLIEPIAPLRISVNHFYSYEHLIDAPSWVKTIEHDPLIPDARRLFVRTYRELLETWNGQQAARSLHKPLLLLQGRADRLQPPEQSQLVFRAANEPKQLELLDTGHLPHLDAPALLAGRLSVWLSRISRSPRAPIAHFRECR